MAPPNNPTKSLVKILKPEASADYFQLSDGNFTVKGVKLLSQVPKNVTFSPFSSVCNSSNSDAPLPLLHRVLSQSHNGGFLGFKKHTPSDRLTNSLGTFNGRDFLSIFRFKTWWSTMWVGNSGSDLQMETQWVLFNVPEIKSYVIIIAIIEGKFRSALNPGINGHFLICAESGSTRVKESNFDAIGYVHVCDNPYNIMKESYSAIRVHLNTFRVLEEKIVPEIVDKFGWCTWDAFYLTVEPIGIWHGLNDFVEGGVNPRFLIIDDGWQSINLDGENPNEDAKNLVLGGEQMTGRLHRLDENQKFRNYIGGSMADRNNRILFDPNRPKLLISKAIEIEHAVKDLKKAIQSGVRDLSGYEIKIEKFKRELDDMFGGEQNVNVCNGGCGDYGMKAFTRDLREKFKGLDDIYVWHALCGAWGGVRPESTHLKSKISSCEMSPGLDGTMEDLAVVKIVEGGIGLVDPQQAGELFDSMHSYLSSVGITGVKMDVIHTLEYVSEEHGGRVELAKAYYKGLSDSIAKNFKGSGMISSMHQCNDFFFLGTKQISMGRTGDDFWFQDPNGDPTGAYWLQGVHMIHCAYNSLWMGQILHPDWDMFQSDHLCAKFHAGSRAICGGPVYVSDSVGCHDFELLKKLVYPDGTIPKCQHFALPTRDCLFNNPLFDMKTLLKIWNFNKYGGVIGAFNCQGAGWDPKERRIKGHPDCCKPLTATIHLTDIEWDQHKNTSPPEEYIIYLNQADKLLINSHAIQLTLQPSSFELFSFVPIKKLGPNVQFSPVGLTNMFNNGGTIQELEYCESGNDEFTVKIGVKGGGNFLAYSNVSPNKCFLNDNEIAFNWFADDGRLNLKVSWNEEMGGISKISFVFCLRLIAL
ncbi:stachyose synthase [Mercurialis annua]|uniref:stachyose synthase n=1 Tax=Mercurialis annua TaxID=3986 RepID=UPI002160D055|nr:stachyose synthase [Mercurialis annua]